jgi:hypothetical protein
VTPDIEQWPVNCVCCTKEFYFLCRFLQLIKLKAIGAQGQWWEASDVKHAFNTRVSCWKCKFEWNARLIITDFRVCFFEGFSQSVSVWELCEPSWYLLAAARLELKANVVCCLVCSAGVTMFSVSLYEELLSKLCGHPYDLYSNR